MGCWDLNVTLWFHHRKDQTPPPFPDAQMMPPRRRLRVGGASGGARIYLSNQMELAKHHTPASALSGSREEGREGGADGG